MKIFTPVLMFLALTLVSAAQAETTNCTAITAVPYTISTPGVYCLTGDLSANFTASPAPCGPSNSTNVAIKIYSDDVVLDLNGHTLKGSAVCDTTGIVVSGSNNTVRNGTVQSFTTAVWIYNDGHVIEDMHLDQNTDIGVRADSSNTGNPKISNPTIRNNRITNTGGRAGSRNIIGIYILGGGGSVLNNDIVNTGGGRVSQESSHLEPYAAVSAGVVLVGGTIVAGNRIVKVTSSTQIDGIGILVMMSPDVTMKDNIITHAQYGISYLYGGTGKYMNNLTTNVITPYTGGTAAGNTNY